MSVAPPPPPPPSSVGKLSVSAPFSSTPSKDLAADGPGLSEPSSGLKPPSKGGRAAKAKSKREEKREEKAAAKLKNRASAPVADGSASTPRPGRFLRRGSSSPHASPTPPAPGEEEKKGLLSRRSGRVAAAATAVAAGVTGKLSADDAPSSVDDIDPDSKTDSANPPVSKRSSRKEKREERREERRSKRAARAAQKGEGSDADSVPPAGADDKSPAPLVQEDLDILRTARISKQGVALEVTHPYPVVKLTPFGDNWAIDSFALIHNAIKAELRDMYNMAVVMQRRKMLLTLRHIEVFYEWWSDFKEFVSTALDVEEEVLFRWIASKEYLRGAFKKSERMKVNGKMRKTMDSVSEYKEKFLPYLPVGERLEGLLSLLDGFNDVLEHYDLIAEQLPDFIETVFKQKEKDSNTKDIITAFRGSDGYDRNLVLLVRWMPDRVMKRWVFSNLKTKDVLSFRSWRLMINREHCRLAARYEDFVMEEEEASLGAPVIGAAMAINEDMREHIDNNRASVRSLPKSAFT